MTTFDITIVDITTPDMLTDHHNRDGEILIGSYLSVNPDRNEAIQEILIDILNSLSNFSYEDLPLEPDEAGSTIEQVLSELHPTDLIASDPEDDRQIWILIKF